LDGSPPVTGATRPWTAPGRMVREYARCGRPVPGGSWRRGRASSTRMRPWWMLVALHGDLVFPRQSRSVRVQFLVLPTLLRKFRLRARVALGNRLLPIFSQLSAPRLQPVPVETLLSQESAHLTLPRSIGFGVDAQLRLGRENTAGLLLRQRRRGHLGLWEIPSTGLRHRWESCVHGAAFLCYPRRVVARVRSTRRAGNSFQIAPFADEFASRLRTRQSRRIYGLDLPVALFARRPKARDPPAVS